MVFFVFEVTVLCRDAERIRVAWVAWGQGKYKTDQVGRCFDKGDQSVSQSLTFHVKINAADPMLDL